MDLNKFSDLFSLSAAGLLVSLVAAHVLGDFVLQTRRDVETKRRAGTLLRHSLIHGLLAYLLCGLWTVWMLPLTVALLHGVIDGIKARLKANAGWFLLDQLAHFVVLAVLAVVFAANSFWGKVLGAAYVKGLILLSGGILAVFAAGHLIGLAVQPLLRELKAAGVPDDGTVAHRSRGFTHGGRLIGQLERSIIFLLVVTSNSAGVGFLLAAKSILRFGEVKDSAHRMEAEYIIIGSLMSFGCGLLIAFVTRALLDLPWG